MSEFYCKNFTKTVCWNDSTFEMEWPIVVPILSDKDRTANNFC